MATVFGRLPLAPSLSPYGPSLFYVLAAGAVSIDYRKGARYLNTQIGGLKYSLSCGIMVTPREGCLNCIGSLNRLERNDYEHHNSEEQLRAVFGSTGEVCQGSEQERLFIEPSICVRRGSVRVRRERLGRAGEGRRARICGLPLGNTARNAHRGRRGNDAPSIINKGRVSALPIFRAGALP
jgi:hypothetical protein